MSRSATPPSLRRVLNELQNYPKDPSANLLQLGPPNEANSLHWEAVMRGVPGTPYEYGLWKLDVQIPDNYPNAPPAVRFVTPICHPNVNFKVRVWGGRVHGWQMMLTRCRLDRRDLPRFAQERVDADIYYFYDARRCASDADGSGAGKSAECGCCCALA